MASTYELIVKAVDRTGSSLSRIESNLKKLDKQAAKTSKGVGGIGQKLKSSASAGNRPLATLNSRLGATAQSSNTASAGIGRLGGALSVSAAGFGAAALAAGAMGRAMIQAAKEMETIENQLRLVTEGNDDLAATQLRLTQLSRQNRSTLGATADLYTKLKVATNELGYSNERVEGLVTKMSQALAVSGADANTANGAIRQFGQAMASGTVRGDEFNSIVEALGPALAIMASESGLTVGKLREMSQAGELTAERFAEILEGSTKLAESFDKMQTPLSTLETQLSEAFTTYLANLSKASGLTSAYRSILEGMLGIMDEQNEKFLKASDPIAQMEIKLQLAKDALGELKSEVITGGTELENFKDSFGSLTDGADDLADSVIQIKPPVNMMTDAIAAAETEVKRLEGELALLKFRQIEAAHGAEYYAQKQKEANEATKVSVRAVSEYDKFFAKLLKTSGEKTQQDMFQLRAQQQLNAMLKAGQINIDMYAAAMEQVRIKTKALKDETEATKEPLSAFQQFMQRTEEQAKSAANEIIFTQLALAKVNAEFAAGRMSIDLYAQYMEILKTKVDETKTSVEAANTTLSGFDLFMKNLIESSANAANEINYKAQAVAELDRMLAAGLISIDTYAQGMLRVKENTKAAGDETETTKSKISGYTQYLNNLVERSREAASETGYMIRAQADLKRMLDEGKLSLDAYANAMKSVGTESAMTAAKLQQMVATRIAEDEASKKMFEEFKAGGDRSKEELAAARGVLGIAAPAKAKEPELTTRQQIIKTYQDQNKELEELQAALANVSALSQEAGVSEEFMTQKLKERIEGLDVYKDKVGELALTMQEAFKKAGDSLADNLADAIVEGKSLMDVFKNSFKSVLKDILSAIIKSGIKKALGGLFGGGGGLMGGGLFGGGTLLGGLFGGFLATGGSTNPAKGYVVGEKGPEFFMPGTTGRVIPNDELGGGGTPPVVNFNINSIDTQTGTEFILKNKKQIEGVVNEAYHRRGKAGIV